MQRLVAAYQIIVRDEFRCVQRFVDIWPVYQVLGELIPCLQARGQD